MPVHDVARLGFEDPGDYEAARPSYPPAALAWLGDQVGIGPGARVVDLASGTGKLTRLLRTLGPALLAIEPVPGMRATFRRVLPEVAVVAGTAEALPIRGESVDVVTVAQAFHWFDHDAALAELARVLRPGGRLALLWNARVRDVDWVDRVWAVMDRVEKHAPWRDHDNGQEAALEAMFGKTSDFEPLQFAVFNHEHVLTPEDVVRRVASVSHVAVLPAEDRATVLEEVRDILVSDRMTRGREHVAIPYRVDCSFARRR
ncbi:MAG: SAM-dependent methyltransferase [Actinomycetia bacterium]|nr:SAM-dependent methyltransferase [Actinomycetes bacterium]